MQAIHTVLHLIIKSLGAAILQQTLNYMHLTHYPLQLLIHSFPSKS